MKILLINSPRLFFESVTYGYTTPPLGISYIKGYLESKGLLPELIDLNIRIMMNRKLNLELSKISYMMSTEDFIEKHQDLVREMVDYLLSGIDLKKYGLLAASIIELQSLKAMLPLFIEVKARNPDIKIVAGGMTHYLIDQSYMENGTIDFMVYNEGEQALYSLIEALENRREIKEVPSLQYRGASGNIERTQIVFDFDLMSQQVSFDKETADYYRFLTNDYDSFSDIFSTPILPYHFSKGCAFSCSFCAAALDNVRVRSKTPEKIVDDLKKIKAQTGYSYFYFYDQHITISKNFLNELMDHIIDKRLDILWTDSIKPLGYMSQSIYDKMRQAGCIMLNLGIESGSERILKLMNKSHSLEDNSNNLRFSQGGNLEYG
jgi:anaerobic magnesium-protoporphyrin IX monomethyl ester cyclase